MITKLNFATVKEAYNIPSEQIKSRQDEIDKLKKIINENSDINKTNKSQNSTNTSNMSNITGSMGNSAGSMSNSNIMSNSTGSNIMNNNAHSEDFDYLFYKLASNPKFDQAVQNYLILKHPDWLNQMNQTKQIYVPIGKSNFGNFNNDDVKHYILFFVFSVIIYLLLGLLIKN